MGVTLADCPPVPFKPLLGPVSLTVTLTPELTAAPLLNTPTFQVTLKLPSPVAELMTALLTVPPTADSDTRLNVS